MDEGTLRDLKQFIAATVTQQISQHAVELSSVLDKLRNEVKSGFSKVEQQINHLSADVAKAIDDSNEETDKQVKDHEHRLTKLAAKAA